MNQTKKTEHDEEWASFTISVQNDIQASELKVNHVKTLNWIFSPFHDATPRWVQQLIVKILPILLNKCIEIK